MLRYMLKSKIHRATVTDADLDYEGSLTIDKKLMEAAGLMAFEQVKVYNISNGKRFDTYIIEGEAGRGDICLNGAAARMGAQGDKIIIASYGAYTEGEIENGYSIIVIMDEDNKIKEVKMPKWKVP